MTTPRILIMAGGTGGHIFPALAVAAALRDRGAEVSWLGTRTGMEADLVPAHDYPIDFIDIAGLRGKGLVGWFTAPLRLLRAVGQSLRVLRRRRIEAVLGMGGFVTGPGGVAARLAGVPLVIHEQNAIAGLTNRLLAPLARRVFEAFPDTFVRRQRVESCGNPIRGDILALPAPGVRFAGREQRLRLLVIGGSLGAAALNDLVPAAIAQLPVELRPQVIHQSGKRHIDSLRENYRHHGVDAELRPFIDDMAGALGWADLVVCRAGALTVSELAAAGVGSVLVPFPYAVDDHQTANGRFLAENGAALLIQQAELDAEQLAGELRRFVEDAVSGRSALLAMALAAHNLGARAASQTVAEACLALAHSQGNQR